MHEADLCALTHPQCCSKQVRVWERGLMKPGTEPACQPHPIGFGFFFSRLLRLNQIVSV